MKNKHNYIIWILVIAVFMVVMNFSEIREKTAGPINYQAAHSGEVVLYGTTWCGYCRKARAFFADHNIPFKDLDVEKSVAAQRAFESVGGRGVPVVTIGDNVVHGYNVSLMRSLLDCKDC